MKAVKGLSREEVADPAQRAKAKVINEGLCWEMMIRGSSDHSTLTVRHLDNSFIKAISETLFRDLEILKPRSLNKAPDKEEEASHKNQKL